MEKVLSSVCGSGRNGQWLKEQEWCVAQLEGGGPKALFGWNDQVQAAVKSKEDVWKEVLYGAYKEENRKLKRCIY